MLNHLFKTYPRTSWRKTVHGPCSFFSVHLSLPPQEINRLSLPGCKRKLEFYFNVWGFKRVRADMESNAEVPSGSITFVGNCVGWSIVPITCDNHLNESMKQHKASTIKACWSSSRKSIGLFSYTCLHSPWTHFPTHFQVYIWVNVTLLMPQNSVALAHLKVNLVKKNKQKPKLPFKHVHKICSFALSDNLIYSVLIFKERYPFSNK